MGYILSFLLPETYIRIILLRRDILLYSSQIQHKSSN